jgi:hypothetical protein
MTFLIKLDIMVKYQLQFLQEYFYLKNIFLAFKWVVILK